MAIRDELLNIWDQVRAHLPADFDLERTALERRAFLRKREVKDVASLFRLCMAYGGYGMSLAETCAWAEAVKLASLSGPSLMERLCKAAPWLGHIVAGLITQQATMPVKRWAGYRLRAIDATALCQPGSDRTTWRLHVGFDLASGQVDQMALTDGRSAENLQRLTYRPGEIVLGDRIYARAQNLRGVKFNGADFIVRTGWNSLRLERADGGRFDLFAMLRAQQEQEGEIRVCLDKGADAGDRLELRLVIWRKTPEQAQAEQRRLLRNAKKRGTKIDPRSLEAAKYVMLVTSLPADMFPACDVLAIYRFRWQIELAFKRMKSLAGLDELTAKDPALAQAWMYARLIAFLIAEQIAGQVPDSPPSEPGKTDLKQILCAKPVALADNQNDPCGNPREHRQPAVTGHSQCPKTSPSPFM